MAANDLSYAFDANSGETPQSLQRKRDMLAQMLQGGGQRTPQNVGEGINSFATSLADAFKARHLQSQIDASQKAGAASADSAFAGLNLFDGGAPAAPPSSAPAPAAQAAAADANPVMALASGMIGTPETSSAMRSYLKDGGQNLDPATKAWCAAQVNSALQQNGIPGTGSDMARSFLNWGSPTKDPARGDVAVFSRGDPNGPYGHVGFYDKTNPDGTIRVLGGNQGNTVGYGDQDPSRLLGYRHYNLPGAQGGAAPPAPLPMFAAGTPPGAAPSLVQPAQPQLAQAAPRAPMAAQAPPAPAPVPMREASPQEILQAMGHPFMGEPRLRYLQGELDRIRSRNDPATQLGLEKTRGDIAYTGAQTQNLLHPQISPGDAANMTWQRQKFAAEQAAAQAAVTRGEPQAQATLAQTQATTANLVNPRQSPDAAANLDWQRQKFAAEQAASEGKPLDVAGSSRLYDRRTGKVILGVDSSSAGGADGYGLQPQTGVDAQGNPVLIQLGKNGKAIQTKMPNGVTLSNKAIKIDAGTQWILLDPVSRQQVGSIPKDVAGLHRDEAFGNQQGKMDAAAPQDMQSAKNALDLIDNIRSDPNIGYGVGTLSPIGNKIPKTPGYDFQNKIDHAKAGAFLTAIQAMRGLGSLSDAEGAAATRAVARMDTSTSRKAFDEAINDYGKIVKQGHNKAAKRLGMPDYVPAPTGGKEYTFNPATGLLE